MEWVEFLEEVATEHELSTDQKQAFIARFDLKNSAKTEKQIANQTKDSEGNDLFAGEAAFKKLMTQVYRKLQPLCPELETSSRGKQPKLKAFLQAKFKQRQSIPDPPIPRSSSEAIPESSTLELPPLRNQQNIPGNGQGIQINDAQAPVIAGANPVVNIHLREGRADTYKKTILMLAASPESATKPRWREELKKIRGAVDRAKSDGRFEVQDRSYIGSSDLSEELTKLTPFVIHISGCVDGVERLFLKDTGQNIDNSSRKELIGDLFKEHVEAKKIDCVILSGCYLEEQTREIVQHINFVIGITADLEEVHAVQFLNEFYYQLASGREIEASYRLGYNLIKREGCSEELSLPRLFTKNDEVRRRDLEKELDICLKQIEKDPSNVQLRKKKASLLTDLGRIDEVDDAYEKVSSLDPENPSIRVQQGDALEQLGDHKKANAAYEKALELDEKDYKVWWKKARVLVKAGKNMEAGECYKNALSLLPPSPDNYVICREYGNALGRLEQFYESILLYQTSLCLQPNYRIANHDKKQVYKKIYAKK